MISNVIFSLNLSRQTFASVAKKVKLSCYNDLSTLLSFTTLCPHCPTNSLVSTGQIITSNPNNPNTYWLLDTKKLNIVTLFLSKQNLYKSVVSPSTVIYNCIISSVIFSFQYWRHRLIILTRSSILLIFYNSFSSLAISRMKFISQYINH